MHEKQKTGAAWWLISICRTGTRRINQRIANYPRQQLRLEAEAEAEAEAEVEVVYACSNAHGKKGRDHYR